MESHTWREKSEGDTLVYRASYHGGDWKLERAPKVGRAERDNVDWATIEFDQVLWETLRELLWRKYQRKRCPWKLIDEIDKVLEDDYGKPRP